MHNVPVGTVSHRVTDNAAAVSTSKRVAIERQIALAAIRVLAEKPQEFRSLLTASMAPVVIMEV